MDDLNFRIPVSAVPDVDRGLGEVESRFDRSRRSMERPIRSTLDFDTAPLEKADRSMVAIRKKFEKPITLKVDASALENVSRRRGRSGAAAATPGYVARSGGGEIPFVDDPIGLKSIATQRDSFEQQVRDQMAAIVRGMKKRADAENAIANRARAELEARGRLGLYTESPRSAGRDIAMRDVALGDINGPAVRGRFSPAEMAERRRRAEYLQGNARGSDADSRAIRWTRRGGASELSDFGIDAGNGYNGGGVSGPSRLSRSGRGGAGGGGRGDVLRGLANTLPGLGPAGVILMGLNAVANAPENLKAFRDNTRNFGAVSGTAQTVGDAIGVGGIARNMREGLESITSTGLSYILPSGRNLKAEETRRFAVQDARAEMQARMAEKRERDNALINPMLAGLAGSARGDRQASAFVGLKDEFDIRRLQLQQGYQNQGGAFDQAIMEGRNAKLGGEAMQALEKSVADARIAAGEKYAKEVAELEKQLAERNADVLRDARLASERDAADLEQRVLESQGRTLDAAVGRMAFDADRAVEDSKRALAKAAEDYGPGSPQFIAALQARDSAEANRYANDQYFIPAARARNAEEARARSLGYESTLEGFRSGNLRRRGERTGDQSAIDEASRMDVFGQYRGQIESLRQIALDKNATGADRDSANLLLRDLPNQLRESLKDVGQSRVTGRDLANSVFTNAQDARGQSGYGLAMRESFLANGGKTDQAKTAEGITKMVQLLTTLVQRATGSDDPISELFSENG